MRFTPKRLAATAVVLAALTAAGTGGWWASSTHSTPVSIAADREAAESAGETAVATLTTASYTTADADLHKWETVTTGPLLDQIRAGHAQGVTALQTAKSVTTGRVLDAALSELSPDTAQLVAVVEVNTRQGTTPAVVKHNRFQATVTRTPDGWKLSAVQPVTVSL
ncbi:hypothetical protein VSH64_17945 [Amycolatopsis rhabdoformis]|uniref:Mce-associated membrane protein n=1 Tax=Amycolatopsis rhabdoformis TaxID=1448059 RepID=A0ABZ1IMI2_9PSEU|nr:hypothetical protein [Amycolatopsis rhabdoformis]WSE35437.1 hypothetical protein VSH64_17945 [Amycolatopsis rhabdoformis]